MVTDNTQIPVLFYYSYAGYYTDTNIELLLLNYKT